MKRWFGLGVFIILGMVSIGFAAPVAAADSETVTQFHFSEFSAEYYLSRDKEGFSELKVIETLVAEFKSIGNNNHGIERALPRFYKFSGDGKTQTHAFDLQIEGVSDPYSERKDGDFTVLRIGDPDATVRGTKEYKIAWSARNVTRNFNDGDEFYWNANGTGWSQSFDAVAAFVYVPADLVGELDGRVKCGVGRFGDAAKNCEYDIFDGEDGEKIFIFTSTEIMVLPGETLTFDIGFKPGTFAEPPFDIGAMFGMSVGQFWFMMTMFVVATIVAMWWFVVILKKFRPIKTKRAIIPEYLPPADMSVMESAFWHASTKAAQVFMSATLMNLAVNHYVEIVEEKKTLGGKKFSLKLAKLPDDRLSADDREILDTIFDGHMEIGHTIKTTDFPKNRKLARVVSSLPAEIQQRFQDKKGFYHTKPAKGMGVATGILFASVGIVILYVALMEVTSGIIAIFVIPAAIAGISMFMCKPISLQGSEMKDYLEGLKMYMKLAESERLKVLQSVKGAERKMTDQGEIIKLYEKLLPYAVIFGIMKDWAKALQVYYDQAPSLAPVWYVGSVASLGSFDAKSFANSINTFSSSGSGFSSGGGGGFSGGGGGGGGGGGW